jgi:hypothetical protein
MMRQNFRSHGKHCYRRSFPTKCQKCGVDVLYWECTHGSKLFFEYPPYGKLVRHYCRKSLGKNIKKKYPVFVKRPEKILENASPSCPACGKLFKNEDDLREHLKQLKTRDDLHEQFYKNDYVIKTEYKKEKSRIYGETMFGKINVRPKKQE